MRARTRPMPHRRLGTAALALTGLALTGLTLTSWLPALAAGQVSPRPVLLGLSVLATLALVAAAGAVLVALPAGPLPVALAPAPITVPDGRPRPACRQHDPRAAGRPHPRAPGR